MITLTSKATAEFGLFRHDWRCFSEQAGPRLWWAVALLVMIGLLEGTGLVRRVALLPALGPGAERQRIALARALTGTWDELWSRETVLIKKLVVANLTG